MKKSFLNKEPKSFHLYLSMKSCFRMLDPKRQLFKRRVTSRLATPLGDPRGVPKCFRKCFYKRYHSVHSKKRLQDLFGLNKFEYSVIVLIIAFNHNRSILKVNIDFTKMDEFNIDWPLPMDPLELFVDKNTEVLPDNSQIFNELEQFLNIATVNEIISKDAPYEAVQEVVEPVELQPPAVEAFIAPDVNIAVDPNNILNMQHNLQPSFTITPPTSPIHQVQFLYPPAANDQVVAIAPVMAPPAPVVAAPAPVVAPVVNQFVQQQEQPTFI